MSDGKVTFPGIERVVRASMTNSHGITPSVCTITMAPQKDFPAAGGTLSFSFRDVKLTWQDCRIDLTSYQRSSDGLTWTLSILDRRWKWKFGKISGVYNRSQADGKIDRTTEKKPSELAKLCLEAMGENDVDTSAIPDDQRPDVSWDYANPAQSLARLLDQLGLRVLLGLDNKVKIVKLGTGKQLPSGAITDDAGTIDPPERPDKLLLVGAIRLFQAQLELEAVGLDTDGSIRKINELSYKPAAGWKGVPLEDPNWSRILSTPGTPQGGAGGVAPPRVTRIQAALLAQQTVFRWYRVKGHRDGTLNIPGMPEPLKSIEQIFPLFSNLVEQAKDPFNENRKKSKPARVVGVFFVFGRGGGMSDRITPDIARNEETECQTGFVIDAERGIVQFSNPVATYEDSATGWVPARIFLETSFGLSDAKTRGPLRYERELKASGQPYNTKEEVYRDDGFLQTSYAAYSTRGGMLRVTKNDDVLNEQADAYLKEVGERYEVRQPHELHYAGLLRIDLDGAIQQVSWSVGPDGSRTQASRNNEHNLEIPTYAERRRLEKNKAGQEQIDRLGDKVLGAPQFPNGLIA